MTPSSDLSGTKLLHYQLDKQLRQRPSSALYLATDSRSKNPVFVELVPADKDEELHGRFHRRMDTLAQIDHPGIAPILEVGVTAAKITYAAITHIDGRTLAQTIADGTTPIDTLNALTLVRQLANILQTTHPLGLFHHDLRPQNILLPSSNTPILIDLGVPLSHQPVSDETLKQMTILDYASPEQQAGKPLTGRSNIFSLGVILYELLAGHPPRLPRSQWDIFNRDQLPQEIPLEEIRPDLTAVTHIVVRKCLWRNEWNRYQTIDALIVGLDEAIAAETRAQQAPPPRRIPLSRQQLIYGAIALATLALIILAILLSP